MKEAVFAERALVRIGDLAGRTRGTGFVADGLGTVITSHEAVDGLSRLVVHIRGRERLLVESDAITPLPEWDLALIRTDGLGVAPLLVGADRTGAPGAGEAAGTRVLIPTEYDTGVEGGAGDGHVDGDEHDGRHAGGAADRWTVGELSWAPVTVVYTSTSRSQEFEGALELALPEATADRFRVGGPASGSPVLDAATGAVVAVVGTALHAPQDARRRFAVPLRTAGLWDAEGQLAATLARNGATVHGYGRDLNFAGALQLAQATAGPALERAEATRPFHAGRAEVVGGLREFVRSGASVAALVGRPGTGRTTALARFAAERSGGEGAAPTVWMRGAELRRGDGSVRAAVGRALRAVSGAEGDDGARSGFAAPGEDGPGLADVVARLARDARRPLLVLLDAPEEMPLELLGDVRRWAAGTAGWLQASGARMVLACGPELWALLGESFPAELLYGRNGHESTDGGDGELPPCLRLGDLRAAEAAHARGLYGLGAGDLAAPDAGHPLTMRMLAEVRAEQTGSGGEFGVTERTDDTDAERRGDGGASGGQDRRHPESRGEAATAPARQAGRTRARSTGHAEDVPHGRPPFCPRPLSRDDVFSAYLDLTALRIARRMAGEAAPARVRRLAVRTAGRLHEAARRAIGPARGALSRTDFEEVFPREGGCAAAVLAEGVLEAAGERFRFADEEFGDWMQGRHLDVDAALETFVHGPAAGADAATGAIGGGRSQRQRIGPVVHALVLSGSLEGVDGLERRLRGLADVVVASAETGRPAPDGEARWWAGRLLRETLLRVPDVRPCYGLLRGLAESLGSQRHGAPGEFGASFWRRLALPTAQRIGLLRLLLPADAPPDGGGGPRGERFLDAVGEMLAAEPETVMPLLCGWFTDRRPLSGHTPPTGRAGTEARPGTVGRSGAGIGAAAVEGRADGAPANAPWPELPRPTVATAAQALLYTYRRLAGDLLLDLLTDACHPRADELLGELAYEEPSSFCRAVERWADHPSALRQIAAAEHGPRMARRARSRTDRTNLERAAHTLLRLPGGSSLHAPNAMAMLLRLRQGTRAESRRVPERDRDLVAALGLLAATGSGQLSAALADETDERPVPALEAFRSHWREQPGDGAHRLTAVLARVRRADLAVPVAELVREYAEMWPEYAEDALAEFARGRIAQRPCECCPGLRLLTDALLCTPYARPRAGLVRGLGDAGGPVAEKLLSVLLVGERDPVVLDAARTAGIATGGSGTADGRDRTGCRGTGPSPRNGPPDRQVPPASAAPVPREDALAGTPSPAVADVPDAARTRVPSAAAAGERADVPACL